MFEHKDISVDNNANGQESVADIDEVDGEVEENTKMYIVMIRMMPMVLKMQRNASNKIIQSKGLLILVCLRTKSIKHPLEM